MSSNPTVTPAAVVPRKIPDPPKPFRFIDVLIIIICLFSAFCFVRLFYNSLFQTLTSNLEPIGYVTMKFNNIQRRQGDRMIWDRINNESPIYPGDIIRVAELSGVNLHFDNNSISLDENTMIRVVQSVDGSLQLELSSGSLNLETAAGDGEGNEEGTGGASISLVVGGRTIETQAGTALSLSSTNNETTLNISEGSAVLIDESGNALQALAGAVVAFTAESEEIVIIEEPELIKEIYEEEIIEEIVEEGIEEIEETAEIEEVEEIEEEPLPPPPPPLRASVNLQPENGYVIDAARLRSIRNLTFNWSPVSGANAYIFTLYHNTPSGRRLITRTNPFIGTSWTLSNLRTLTRGRFTWQVEAVYRDSNGIIQRRGNLAERFFIVDIPVPEVELNRDMGNLYGN